MTHHLIEIDPRNIHGYLSNEIEPVARINRGDLVTFKTLDAQWNYYDSASGKLLQHEAYWNDPMRGHALSGPIHMNGLLPNQGTFMKITVIKLRPSPKGWTWGGGSKNPLAKPYDAIYGDLVQVNWDIDNYYRQASSEDIGISIPISPFMGVMALAPARKGFWATRPPYIHGGNIDCSLLVEGASLYLPVQVEGGLFSTGDGHAAQGDGELSGYAIEAPMDHAEFHFDVVASNMQSPFAQTHEGWVTFGLSSDIHIAIKKAINAMLDLIIELHRSDITREEALAIASVAVDVRITQLVNAVKGAHAVLNKNLIFI